jgi:large conductance mechanosensitive channel
MQKFKRLLYLLPFLFSFLTFKFCENHMAEYKAEKWGETLSEGDYILYIVISIFVFVFVFNLIRTGSASDSIDLIQQKKDCPFCKKRIHIEAVKCPHCSSEQFK